MSMPLSRGSFSSSSVSPARPSSEERTEGALEVFPESPQGLGEARLAGFIDPRDRFGCLRNGINQVLALCRQKCVTGFQFVELLDPPSC
jgi:hypothetical protein